MRIREIKDGLAGGLAGGLIGALMVAGALGAATAGGLVSTQTVAGVPGGFYRTTGEPEPVNSRVWAGKVAEIRSGGDAVAWKVKIRCPRGEEYRLEARLFELNPARHPILAVDGDNGIPALAVETGTCKGGVQVIGLRLVVQVSRWGSGCAGDFCWEAGSEYLPIGPDDAEAIVELSGQGFSATYISHEAAASSNGVDIDLRG